MIRTLTPNPSLDQTIEVTELTRGATLRGESTRLDPGGKGLNIARALGRNGAATTAVLPTGGTTGQQLCALLATAGVTSLPVPIDQPVRTNLSIVEPDGTVTKVNTAGPALDGITVDQLLAAALKDTAAIDWIVGGGSLSPRTPVDLYARLVTAAREHGIPVAIDTSGPSLATAITAAPIVVKPNRAELAEASGRPVATLGAAVDAAQVLRERGAGCVLASLGPDGALLVDATGVLHGEAPPVTVRSPVGAGDAMLAGFLAAGGSGRTAFAQALAWGAAAASLPGSQMPGPADIAPVQVQLNDRINHHRPLEGV